MTDTGRWKDTENVRYTERTASLPRSADIFRQIEADEQIALSMQIVGKLSPQKEAALATLALVAEIIEWREAKRLALLQEAVG